MQKFPLLLCLLIALASARADEIKLNPPVILDEMGVKNLGIETVEAEETDFEETIFALGLIEVLPGKKGVVSSRVSGRAQSILALPDMKCDEGDELVWIESRQPGDPPPVVRLDAPLSGIISKVNVAVGQPVDPGDSLVEIYDLTIVEAAAAVPEHLAGKLTKGLKARVRIAAFPDEVFEAELAHLGAEGDSASGTLEAAFHLQNPDLKLRPGMRAEFSIVTGKREGVMSVPRATLQGDPASRFVYVKDYDLPNAFVKIPVEVGQLNNERVEILSGLRPGDEVVTRGAYSLAFAGKGSVSLKEALDAAHGHPHNEDGTEMTSEQQAGQHSHGGEPGHDDHEGAFSAPLTKVFAATTFVLLVLLLLATFKKGSAPLPANKEARE